MAVASVKPIGALPPKSARSGHRSCWSCAGTAAWIIVIYTSASALTGIGGTSEHLTSGPGRARPINSWPELVTVAWATSDVYPLTDVEAGARVDRKPWEVRPDNVPFNHTVPTPGQLKQLRSPGYMDSRGLAALAAVTGNFTGTTDEILQWGARKWGVDPDLVRASAQDESSWHQNMVGDIENGVSLGIMQIKSRSHLGTCPQSPQFPPAVQPSSAQSIQQYLASEPSCLSYNSTAFAVDYRLAHLRACMNKSIGYLFNHDPVSGHSRYADAIGDELLWGCVGTWYSGYFWDAGSLAYIERIQRFYVERPWLDAGF